MNLLSEGAKQAVAELKTATPRLRIHFPEADVGTGNHGVKLARQAAAPAPALSILRSSLGLTPPEGKFVVAALDLDAPFPSLPFMSPLLHALDVDHTLGEAADAEWAPLVAPAGHEPIAPWIPSTPPPGSGPHRYVFLVWEQPAGLTAAQVRSELVLAENVGMWARLRFDEEGFEKKLGLGKILAANFFLV